MAGVGCESDCTVRLVKLGQEQETAGQVQVQPDAQVDRQITVQAISAAGD